MLKDRLLRLSENRLAHISLGLVGLMLVLPFLAYHHRLPIPSFYPEWWSAVLGVLALVLLLDRASWQPLQIPRIVQLPAALALIVLLQSALGMVGYFNQTLLFTLYMLFAAMLMLLGAKLRACLGLEKIATVLAIFLLVGAELSAIAGVLQYFDLQTYDAVVMPRMFASIYGNLAQPNHYADYIAWGLVSLGLLFQRRSLKVVYVVALALPLLFVLKQSGSRSALLFLLMMNGLAWWSARRHAELRPLLRYSLMLLAGFGAMFLIAAYLPVLFPGGTDYFAQRAFTDVQTGFVRLYLWREATLMFMQSPWLGVGFGQFAWHHLQLVPLLRPDFITLYFSYAHNIIFHFAAELGVAGLAVLFASLGMWLYGLKQVAITVEYWWGYAILGVLAIHSLLEYPMWYIYFLAVAALLLGALDQTSYRPGYGKAWRASVAVIIALGLALLFKVMVGYDRLEQTLQIYPESREDKLSLARIREGLVAAQSLPLLSQYADLTMTGRIEVNPEYLKEKLALNSRVVNFMPYGAVVYRQALLLAQNGQLAQARTLLEQAIWSYPNRFPEVREQLTELAEKDPEHFSALLKFANQTEQEHAHAVHKQ